MPSPPVLTVQPSGCYTLPLVRCAQLLASCAEVRTMLGAATAALALDAIDYPTRDVENYVAPVPGIIVEGLKQEREYSGGQRGELEIALYDAVDPAYAISALQPLDFKNDTAAWLNRVGAIVDQFLTASKQPMADFGGHRFDALSWADVVYPQHCYDELASDAGPQWFRFAVGRVRWTT